jgi:thymidine phosphorylase
MSRVRGRHSNVHWGLREAVVLVLAAAVAASAGEVAKISGEGLLARAGKPDALLILDVH